MRTQRLLSCLLLLQGKRHVTAREFARQLDVSMRTVYRDIEALSAAGVPVRMERGPLGGIILSEDYRQVLAQFTSDELQALFVSGSGPMNDLGMTAQLSALQKLSGTLPTVARETAESGRARLFLDYNRWDRDEQPIGLLRHLRSAIQGDHCLRLRYRDRGGTVSERCLDPLGLVAKAGIWYLIAREPNKGYRTFRAQRIAAVEQLSSTFTRPTDFNLEEYWTTSVSSIERQPQDTYEVILRVERSAATAFFFWKFHVLSESAEHSTLRVGFPSRDLAIAMILIHSDEVRIISPHDLSSAVVARARRALANFDTTSDVAETRTTLSRRSV